MKYTLYIILFLFPAQSLFSQANYSKETLAKIRAVENGLAERVKVAGEPDYNIIGRMKHHKVKGLSIAVVDNYKVVWAKGYGWANEEEKKPVTITTLFEPGSISKSLNAVGVLKLVQDKKLDLHTDVNTYLTSWKFPYDSISKGKKITLAQLLSHSAGLNVHGFPGYDSESRLPTVPQVLDGVTPANTPAVRSIFEPGLRFQYSGGGTTVTQLVVTDVTKQPYDVYMYEQVLKPMGMTNSFFTQPAPKEKRALCAAAYHADGMPVSHQFHAYAEQGAAGLWMTPTDLCQYIIETQLAYAGKSSKVLNQAMTKLRLTPYNDESAALGVFIEQHDSSIYFQHSAGNEGFSGQYFGSLDGKGVVVFINSDNPAILHEVVNSVALAYDWKGFYEPVYKKAVPVAESILQTYPGIYQYEDKWASVLKRDNEYYFFAEGIYSKMYFSSDNSFFNKEFMADKQFVTDKTGAITGYTRKVNGVEYPTATKIVRPDTLQLSIEELNNLGWHLLENKMPANAQPYLQRALQIKPADLLSLGNLAHCYLFANRYEDAINIYKAHMNESLQRDFSWRDMIQQDFQFFKNHGCDTGVMNKALAELGMSKL